MSSHLLDPSRLDALRTQREAIFAAAGKVSETIRDLTATRSRLASEIHRVNYDASNNLGWMDRGERQKRVDELNAELAKIEAEIAKAKSEQEPLNERRQAIGQLYTRCAEFMGVDPYGR